MKQNQKYYEILENVISSTLLSVVDVNTDKKTVEFLISSPYDTTIKSVFKDFQVLNMYTKMNLVHPKDYQLFDNLMNDDYLSTLNVSQGQVSYEFLSKLHEYDNNYRWIKLRLLTLEKKEIGYHLIASFEDIHEFKEKELRQKRIRTCRMLALKNAFEELYIIDPDKNTYEAFNANNINEEHHPNGTYCYDDFIKLIELHVHPDDKASCLQKVSTKYIKQSFVEGKKNIYIEYRMHKVGYSDYRWMYAIIMRMDDEDGGVSGLMLVKDITTIKHASELEMQNRLLKDSLDMQIRHYKYMQETENEMRYFRHDLKNHLLVLESLSEQKKYDEFKLYIENMRGFLLKEKEIVHTNHTIVDALLNEKFAFAQQMGIKVDYKIHLADDFTLSAVDLCILLGNSLDNAIRACQEISDKEQRHIEFCMVYAHHVLVISVMNTIDPLSCKEGVSFETTKENHELHGFGIRNMRNVVEKYQGVFEISQKVDKVTLKMSLYF